MSIPFLQNRTLFFYHFPGLALNGKRCKCLCTCEFSTFRPPPKPEKSRLLGPAPNPAEPRAKLARSSARLVASHSLSLLFLIFLLPGQAEQIINVCFCRCDFPHIFPGFPVLGVELLFFSRQPAAFLLLFLHLWELRPVQNGTHFGPRRPVNVNICLMLRKEFFTVP